MKLIVGLGNPGEKYENTRHNVGFVALDHLLQKFETAKNTFWTEDKKFKSLIKEVDFEGEKVILMKPTTFMNESGIAVASYSKYFKIDPSDIYVLHDELDLPLGKIKIKYGGGSAGNNGVTSIMDHLGTDQFLRIRMGIGKSQRAHATHDASDYVLGIFDASEKRKVKTMTKQVVKDVLLILDHGIDLYMSKYNN